MSFLEQYDFTKEDWDNIVELCKMPGKPDLLALIPPKVCIKRKGTVGPSYLVSVYTKVKKL